MRRSKPPTATPTPTPIIGAMKGMKWESPRGPISIDPQTRDIVQNVYIRKVRR